MSVRLHPAQVCFVVDDVRAAADACERRFGWGPFHHFTARVPEAHYRGWSGRRENDVALGMAGGTQVELVHVHEGREPIADYQERYGTGFQHLGVACRSLAAGIEHLTALGAAVAERNEHEGIGIAFVDTPTGPAMLELLQFPPKAEANEDIAAAARPSEGRVFAVDRATIATADMQRACAFYADAFGWEDVRPQPQTLRHGGGTTTALRCLGRAGTLTLELIQPDPAGDDPYALHLRRGEHGLVHAGGMRGEAAPGDGGIACEWLETGERFTLHDWAGGVRALQVREA